MEAAFSNAEKIAAVVAYWAGPRLRQLWPEAGELLTSAIRPLVMSWAQNVPDEAIPGTAAEVVKRAKALGRVRVWRVELDPDDIAELDALLRANLPYKEQPAREYRVKTPEQPASNNE